MVSNANLLVKQGLLTRPLDFGFVMGDHTSPHLPRSPYILTLTTYPSRSPPTPRPHQLPLALTTHPSPSPGAPGAQECSLRQLGHLVSMLEPGDTWTSIGVGAHLGLGLGLG